MRRVRRALAHAGLALVVLLAQLTVVTHVYTAHRAEAREAALARKVQAAPGDKANDLCPLCLAYGIFASGVAVEYGSQAIRSAAADIPLPRAAGTPYYPFSSYASRAPPKRA